MIACVASHWISSKATSTVASGSSEYDSAWKVKVFCMVAGLVMVVPRPSSVLLVGWLCVGPPVGWLCVAPPLLVWVPPPFSSSSLLRLRATTTPTATSATTTTAIMVQNHHCLVTGLSGEPPAGLPTPPGCQLAWGSAGMPGPW